MCNCEKNESTYMKAFESGFNKGFEFGVRMATEHASKEDTIKLCETMGKWASAISNNNISIGEVSNG